MKHKRPKQHGIQPDLNAASEFGVRVPMAPHDRVLSPNEIGKILNLTGEAVKQWIYHRRLPAVKLANGYWKIKVSDLETFLKGRYEAAKSVVLIFCKEPRAAAQLLKASEASQLSALLTTNSTDALLKMQHLHPALFVLHILGEDKEPWILAQKLRRMRFARGVPILLVAERDLTEHEAAEALELPAQGCVRLPAQAGELQQTLQRLLHRIT